MLHRRGRPRKCVDCHKKLGDTWHVFYTDGRRSGSWGRRGRTCSACAAIRYYHGMLHNDKLWLYVHQRLTFLPTTFKLIALHQGYYVAERLYCQQLAARHEKAVQLAKAQRREPPARQHMPYRTFAGFGDETFEFKCTTKSNCHNWCCCERTDVWFYDWHGQQWWGRWIAAVGGRKNWPRPLWYSNESVVFRKTKVRSEVRLPPPPGCIVAA